MKEVKTKSDSNAKPIIKLKPATRRFLILFSLAIIGAAIILIILGTSSAVPLGQDYQLTYSIDTHSDLIYGTVQSNSNYTHVNAVLQIVYQGVPMMTKNFTGQTSWQLPMTSGTYTFQVTNANGTGILMYQQVFGGLSTQSQSSLLSILGNVGVVGGILVAQLIIAFSTNLLFIRRLTVEGMSTGEGMYKGDQIDNDVYEHKKTLTEPMTKPNQVAEWMKQKKYVNLNQKSSESDTNGVK